MTWRAYLARTMDGRLGAELDLSAGSVSVPLNGIPDLSVTCSAESLSGLDRYWFSPRSGCVVVTWQSGDGPESVVEAGPIMAPLDQDRQAGTVTLKAQGIAALLAERTVTGADYGPGEESALGGSVIEWSGVDLGSIVGRIVTAATSKRAGWLPIVVPPERAANRQRTYEGFNVANNGAWKRIEEITEVINGPDVAFRPRWVDESQRRVEWVLVTGTEDQPTIAQDHATVWDATSRDSPVASITVVSDAGDYATRVYATGAGEGPGTLIRIAEVAPPEWMPLVERVVSGADTDNPVVVEELAASGIVTSATDQVSLTIHAGGRSPLSVWRTGDAVTLVTEGWLEIPDGKHDLRIIAAQYDLASDLVQVECQEDVLGDELNW